MTFLSRDVPACFTRRAGVVKAAMQTGKRAICAGPGNPPVLVDGTSCLKRAAESVVKGAGYDNNLLCIGEKEVFVVGDTFGKYMDALEKAGAVRLNASQFPADCGSRSPPLARISSKKAER